MTELPALPFVSTSPTTFNGGLVIDAHDLSLTANASAPRSSSTSGSGRIAGVSSNASAPVACVSAASFSKLRPTSGTGIVNADAWVCGIFASADGKPYDRDWMSKHNVNDDILEGVPSKHKLDALVRHGAVIVGDKLCVTYHSSGNPHTIEGEVKFHFIFDVISSDPIFALGPTRLHKHQPVCSNRAFSSKIQWYSPQRSRSERSDHRNEQRVRGTIRPSSFRTMEGSEASIEHRSGLRKSFRSQASIPSRGRRAGQVGRRQEPGRCLKHVRVLCIGVMERCRCCSVMYLALERYPNERFSCGRRMQTVLFSGISHTGFREAYIRPYLATCSNLMQTFTIRPSRFRRSGVE